MSVNTGKKLAGVLSLAELLCHLHQRADVFTGGIRSQCAAGSDYQTALTA